MGEKLDNQTDDANQNNEQTLIVTENSQSMRVTLPKDCQVLGGQDKACAAMYLDAVLDENICYPYDDADDDEYGGGECIVADMVAAANYENAVKEVHGIGLTTTKERQTLDTAVARLIEFYCDLSDAIDGARGDGVIRDISDDYCRCCPIGETIYQSVQDELDKKMLAKTGGILDVADDDLPPLPEDFNVEILLKELSAADGDEKS